jgi:hypothetical protein
LWPLCCAGESRHISNAQNFAPKKMDKKWLFMKVLLREIEKSWSQRIKGREGEKNKGS